MMEECVYAHYGRHGMKSIQWVLCAVMLVGTTGLGHTKESNPASSEDQAVSKLDARKCRPATREEKKGLDQAWREFERSIIACPVETSTSGKPPLVVLSVDAYEFGKMLPKESLAPKYPHALLVLRDGTKVGELPYAYPFDPPVSLDVTFSHWIQNFPHRIDLFLEDPAVGGNKKLPSLEWHMKLKRYTADTEVPPVDIVRRFCQLDFDGARLRSAEGDPIWQLTNNSGEPPNNPVSLTTTWDVAETSLGEKDATVVVKYQIVGVVEESPQGPILHRYRRTTSKTFYISKSIDGWKIRLDKLALPPYVSLTAYQRHIDDLLKQPAPDSSGADSYTQTLFRLREDLKLLAFKKKAQ